MRKKSSLLAILALIMSLPFAHAKVCKKDEKDPACTKFYESDAAGVRLEGSTSVFNTLISPNKDDLQQKIKYFSRDTGSGRGVLALIKGSADVAMISASLGTILEQINNTRGSSHKLEEFMVHPLGFVEVAVIVNANNPIAQQKAGALSARELKRILVGRAEKWYDVGVDRDSDILLVTESEGGGIRSVVQETLMKNNPYWSETRMLAKASQINNLVHQHPSAIGLVSSAQVKDTVVRLNVRDFKIYQSLALVTRGRPSPENQRFIDILTGYAKDNPNVVDQQPDVIYKD